MVIARGQVTLACNAELGLRGDPARTSGQDFERHEFPARELDRRSLHANRASRAVDDEIAALQRVGDMAGLASQERAGAGLEFAVVERLDEVIVGTEIESADAIIHFGAGRQHENRRGDATCPQASQDGKAVELRQHDVEDHEVVGLGREKIVRRAAARLPVQGLREAGEPSDDRLAGVDCVLNEQNAHFRLGELKGLPCWRGCSESKQRIPSRVEAKTGRFNRSKALLLILVGLEASEALHHEGCDERDGRDGEQDRGNRALHQRPGVAQADLQGAPELAFRHGPEDQPHHHGGDRVVEPPHQVAQHPEHRQHHELDHGRVRRDRSHRGKHQDPGTQPRLRDREQAHPQPHQRQVQHQQHRVGNEQARDQARDQIRRSRGPTGRVRARSLAKRR